jgi:hypothetical protein
VCHRRGRGKGKALVALVALVLLIAGILAAPRCKCS